MRKIVLVFFVVLAFPTLLFDANGGHGMIFTTFDGRLMLALHQPNSSPKERARLFELEDTVDLLRLKKDRRDD